MGNFLSIAQKHNKKNFEHNKLRPSWLAIQLAIQITINYSFVYIHISNCIILVISSYYTRQHGTSDVQGLMLKTYQFVHSQLCYTSNHFVFPHYIHASNQPPLSTIEAYSQLYSQLPAVKVVNRLTSQFIARVIAVLIQSCSFDHYSFNSSISPGLLCSIFYLLCF